MLFPIIIHNVQEGETKEYKAATSLDAVNDNPEQLDLRLRLIEILYDVTITAASRALAMATSNLKTDFRAFWLAADCIERFTRQMNTAGFFLSGENATLARDLGISEEYLRMIRRFYKKFPDVNNIESGYTWRQFNKTKRNH